jgi:hypothetical protein
MADDLPRGVPTEGGDDASADDATIARQFTACGRCLGAHLVASDTGRDVVCPGCGAVWRDRLPSARRVDAPADMAAIARWLPTICGRALVPGGSDGGRTPRLGDRAESVDAHHRDARSGLRTALASLTRLDQLERLGRGRDVRVLWYAYVLTGEVRAKQNKGGLEDLVAGVFGDAEQLKYWEEHKSRHVRVKQRFDFGTRLLTRARGSYEELVRGALTPPRRAAAAEPDLSGELTTLLFRSLERAATESDTRS